VVGGLLLVNAAVSSAQEHRAAEVVVLTGAKTRFGCTTDLVQQARPALHIDAVMSKVVGRLFVIVGALLVMVVVLSLQRGTPLVEMIPLMLILLMSAILLSLPVMFTVSMAIGSKELAKRAVLGALMVAESLLALWVGWSRWGLAANDDALYTFSFLTLLYFAAFSIVSARERRWFWVTLPSKVVMAAVVAETLVGTVLTFAGLPGLMPLPWWQTLALFAFAMVSCLVVNDAVKVAMIKWRVPTAVA
jgi:hypothetical protein